MPGKTQNVKKGRKTQSAPKGSPRKKKKKTTVVDACALRRISKKLTDPRRQVIKDCVSGLRLAHYTKKLKEEYQKHLSSKDRQRDIVALYLSLIGTDAEKSHHVPKGGLTQSDRAKAREIHWPKEDDHLLAAAKYCEGDRACAQRPDLCCSEGRQLKRKKDTQLHFGLTIIDFR